MGQNGLPAGKIAVNGVFFFSCVPFFRIRLQLNSNSQQQHANSGRLYGQQTGNKACHLRVVENLICSSSKKPVDL